MGFIHIIVEGIPTTMLYQAVTHWFEFLDDLDGGLENRGIHSWRDMCGVSQSWDLPSGLWLAKDEVPTGNLRGSGVWEKKVWAELLGGQEDSGICHTDLNSQLEATSALFEYLKVP